MRTMVLVSGMVLGAVAGAALAWQHGWGVQAVFGSIGCVVGAAIGGFLGRIGRLGNAPARQPLAASDGLAAPQRELIDNYWINRGRLRGAPGHPQADDTETHQ